MTWQEGAITGAAAGGIMGTAVPGLGTITGILGGAMIGALASFFMPNNGAGDGAAAQEMRAYYAGQIVNNTDDSLEWAHTNAANVATVIPDTQLYLARNAEFAAQQLYQYQTAQGLAHTYNASYVISHSLVANDSLSDLWQVELNYNAVLNFYTDLSEQFVGTYSSMNWAVGNGQSQQVQIGNGAAARLQFVNYEALTGSANWLEVQANQSMYLINYATTTQTVTLHIRSGADNSVTSENVTLPSSGVENFNLTEFGLVNGRYAFYTSQPRVLMAGILGADPLTNNVPPAGLLVTSKSGNNETFAVLWGNNERYLTSDPAQASMSGLYPTISVFNGGQWIYSDQLSQPIRDINIAVNECSNLTSIANSYAQTYFNQLTAANGDLATPWADCVFPDPDQMSNLNDEMRVAAYYSYLIVEKNWFLNHTILTPDDVNISAESAHLLVRGTVYGTSGNLLVGNNTIWTPFVMLSNTSLHLGWNNITQTGFVCTWYNGNTILDNNTFSNFTYVPITLGDRFYIDQIWYNNASVASVNLTVHAWTFYLHNSETPTPHPPGVEDDLAWLVAHWYYIAMLAGIVFLVAAIAVRNTTVAIIGLILLAAALVGWYMAGDFSLLSFIKLQIQSAGQWVIWRR